MAGTVLQKWKKAPDIIERTIDGEKVLLHMKTGVYYSLNETGSAIWDVLSTPSTLDEIVDRISVSYSGKKDKIIKEVAVLLEELGREQLAVIEE